MLNLRSRLSDQDDLIVAINAAAAANIQQAEQRWLVQLRDAIDAQQRRSSMALVDLAVAADLAVADVRELASHPHAHQHSAVEFLHTHGAQQPAEHEHTYTYATDHLPDAVLPLVYSGERLDLDQIGSAYHVPAGFYRFRLSATAGTAQIRMLVDGPTTELNRDFSSNNDRWRELTVNEPGAALHVIVLREHSYMDLGEVWTLTFEEAVAAD